MPPVDWTIFEQLPGSAELNFEMLCRALIRRHYGQYGDFAALAAQPGVEFHLKLHIHCSLGDQPRWYGWQCRWYDLQSGRPIGTGRRNKIIEAIKTTERELPGLTDWVLWTRRPLTAGDQKWFYGLKTHMQLHLWTTAEVEEHLSDDALIFRSTYFGELVLTPDSLLNLHSLHVAPIRRRWLPDAHQAIDTERTLRRMLGENNTWDELQNLANQLEVDASAVDADLGGLVGPLANATIDAAQFARVMATILTSVHMSISNGDIDLLRQQLAIRPKALRPDFVTLPGRLRANSKPATLTVTNALNEARKACKLLDDVDACLGMRLVAILADAGYGKTQLAAQFTAPLGDRPCGLLLLGKNLHAGQSLNDLARRVTIQGNPVSSMEALVAALDAAGQRAHRRLPIVIDGLNEAEDPRNWKSELASLDEMLKKYPHVLVVCTLRNAFAKDALPPDIVRLEISDFGKHTIEAIRKYFKYYRINPADAELPIKLLGHPLTLRLFCEVTNPKREQEVGIEAMPKSLTALFESYLEMTGERIMELMPRLQRYYEQDIRIALDEIGILLWEQNDRSLDEFDLRRRLRDEQRPWDASLIYAFEQEGIILRTPSDIPNKISIAPVYDALAGHLIAKAILARYGSNGLAAWLKDPTTIERFTGPLSNQHPLSTDTFKALVGLVPRQLHRQQLWPLLDEPLRISALREAADLEGAYLDVSTVSELAKLVAQPPTFGSRDLLSRLWQTRGATTHPLNAEFLDTVLRQMSVADRDTRWSEWLRHNSTDLLEDVRRLEMRWRDRAQRTQADQLRARWLMWILTSTVRELRDEATKALYWFGRGDPTALFDLTIDSLNINDSYISERLLAASYGVAMAHQLPNPDFSKSISIYLLRLRDNLVGSSATNPTSHWLARLYIQETVNLANAYYPNAIPEGLHIDGRVLFAPGPSIDSIESKDPRALEVNQTLHMDFKNYTLGRLFARRRNYDMDHKGHQAAVAYISGIIWNLGWRENGLGTIDKDLIRYGGSRHDREKTERYGKKYGWIGYYLYAGLLADGGQLPEDERLSELQIDPSFPELLQSAPVDIPIWSRPTSTADKSWMRQGIVKIPDDLLYRSKLDSYKGPWIAVDGFLSTGEEPEGRSVFGILTALLVERVDADRLAKALSTFNSPSQSEWDIPEAPDNYYTFAGEIPWNSEFVRNNTESNGTDLYSTIIQLEDGGLPIRVEILSSNYSWESYHSVLNQTGGTRVPSKPFSTMFDLRGIPQSFNQALPDGTLAAFSFGAPIGFTGHILYLRDDLVHKYAEGRELIWFIWGKRELNSLSDTEPDWLDKIQMKGDDIWRYICKAENLSLLFGAPQL